MGGKQRALLPRHSKGVKLAKRPKKIPAVVVAAKTGVRTPPKKKNTSSYRKAQESATKRARRKRRNERAKAKRGE